ncbi:hypothetical protein Tco_0861954 [Tanacetum coccineum]
MVGILWIYKPVWLTNIDLLTQYAIQERSLHIHLVDDHVHMKKSSATLLLNIFLEVMKGSSQKHVKGDDLKLSNEEKYEHVGPKVTRSQEGERLQDDKKIMYD